MEPFDADEKALALQFALTALIRSLKQSEHLDMDLLFSNLAGAKTQLENIGETEAASALGALSESLWRI